MTHKNATTLNNNPYFVDLKGVSVTMAIMGVYRVGIKNLTGRKI